ncbi:hypothetical protein F5883DRAFT_41993 [Diaporthe sp. PMI_573]|nr:hypothetical protein F5883DRAFT_41993 [Diaporthaceae sp. PMI_573]
MEFENPKTGMFQQTELLRQTVKLWTLLIYQDTNPLRQDVNLASDDLTEKLLSELSRRFPDMNHDGSFKYGHEVFPTDGGAALSEGDDPETVCWMKNRVALQDEFARFVIWKSNFTSRDIALLLSDASPLYRSILETVLSIAETLLGCKAPSLLSIECDYSIANLLLVLDPNPVGDPTLEEVRCGLCHMVTESQRLDWQEMKIAASPVPESIIAEFLEEGRYSGRDSPETVDDNWKDSDGDSMMTDLTQSTISGTDYRLFSDIEKLRHDITSLCDLEITMRKVLHYLRGQDSNGFKPEEGSTDVERPVSDVSKAEDDSKRPRQSMRLAK